MKDWIVTRIALNLDSRSKAEFPLRVIGVNLNYSAPKHGDSDRYFTWRLANVHDPRFDLGQAVIDENVPLNLLQPCRANG